MNLWRGLSRRVLIVGVISTILLASGIGVAMILTIVRQWVERSAELIPPPPDDAMARCRTSPSTWSYTYPRGDLEAWSYDSTTLASANPSAPPLHPDLAEQLRAGEPSPASSTPAQDWAAHVLMHVEPPGPCGLLMVRWPRNERARGTVLGTLGAIALGGVAATLALTALLVLRPLVRRLRRIESAATAVGDDARYRPLADRADDEIGSIARVLDRAHDRIVADAARLDAARLQLERHLADVAHDLRTPLASLGLTLEELSNRTRDLEAQELSGRAVGDVMYLAALVDNLHMASRLADGGALPRGTCELGEIVERVRLRFALLGRERGVTVEAARPEVDVVVGCEAATAERAIANLVHNAIAHGERGGHVALVLDRIDDGRRFRLSVLDDGPGVAPTELPRLGSATFRGDPARPRDGKGTGLGLMITGEVCERSGWTLTFAVADPEAEGGPRGLAVVITGPVEASTSSLTNGRLA